MKESFSIVKFQSTEEREEVVTENELCSGKENASLI